jgi:putative peptidoglycan lipid II flippase
MGIAAAILAASVLLSRFMGLVRDKVISYYHGASLESDIYFASFVVPDFINYLLAGGYFAITLIPLLAARFQADQEDGWRFFSAVLLWVTGAIVLLTAAAMVLAPQLAAVAAPGFGPEALARLTRFLRIILPAQVFFLSGSCLTALLYLRKQFAVPALTPLVYNGCIIAGGVLMLEQGMEGFCWGVLAGSFLGNFLLPLLAAARGEGLRLLPAGWHPDLKRFGLLALPLMLGQSVVVLDEQLLRVFGSLAADGAVSWLNYARRIMLVPVGVVAQAAGVASYPFLAALAAKGTPQADGEFDRTLSTALTNTLLVILPLAAWMLVAAEPTVLLIFQQGRFGAADTAATALCLRIMLAAVFCWALQQVLGRAFYARQDTLTPAVTGTLATLATLPAYWLLGRWFGAAGIAGASALSVGLYTLALVLVWRRRRGRAALAGLLRALLGGTALCAAAALPAWAAQAWARGVVHAGAHWAALAGLAAGGLVFGAVYLLLGRFLAPGMAGPVLGALSRVRSRLGGAERQGIRRP